MVMKILQEKRQIIKSHGDYERNICEKAEAADKFYFQLNNL